MIKGSESNASKERVPDENELVIHIYLNKLKFEKKNGSLLFMSPIKLFLGYIERQEIPTELICIFDDAGCKYEDGHLLANLYDYRHIVKPDSAEPNPNQARKLFTKMKPTQQSIVEDIKYLSEKAKILITKEEVLELESRLLLFHNPVLNLAVDDASIAINNAMMNIKNSKHIEPEKCMKNSSELEEEEAEREEIKRMLIMMKDSPLKNKLMEG
ncbi:hypothetical protein K502DRAFT_108397 [Neoconidiobolus thromboides FSU 785]|nr:hypothetical protein K502DRAFT_108397 [Neoconidiobolus thromboides FSU 785]